MRLAVIDIGTIKLKLLIAEVLPSGDFKVIHKDSALTCLGVQLDEHGDVIEDKRVADTIVALKKFKQEIERYGAKKVKIVSTHILREAKNARTVIQKIKKQTGFSVEVISQKREAELFFAGVTRDWATDERIAAADVGSGSVQVVIGDRRGVQAAHLFKTGAQYVHDLLINKHQPKDITTSAEMEKMRTYIARKLANLPSRRGIPLVFGSSSFLDFFKFAKIPSQPHTASPAHPIKVLPITLQKFIKRLEGLSFAERERMYPFDQNYFVWGIDKAFLNILEIAKRLDSPYILPSNVNINKGLLYGLAR